MTERARAGLAARLRLRLPSRRLVRPIPGRPLPGREALPLALLLLALSAVFVFGHDRSQFYRPWHHDNTSTDTMTVAANLSPEYGFAGFRRLKLANGEPTPVDVYHRFPIGSYALVKLAILPFGDDIPRQLLAARLLMLACFAAAAVLAFLALALLIGDRRIACAAALFACSGYYALHYNDTISAEISTNLFGVMLVFHGMARFERDGRFGQLTAKTAAAILLGWHAAALAVPYAAIGLGRELARTRADGGGARPTDARRLRPLQFASLGAFAALCCALALGWNLASEYRALGGETAPTDLPSFRSLLARTGVDEARLFVGELDWPAFLRGQLGGIAGMTIPFAAADRLGFDPAQPVYGLWPPPASAPRFAAAGAAVLAVCFAGLRFLPRPAPFAALLLAGWAWAIPFRGEAAFHEFEAVFHVGYPLALCTLALLGLRRLLGPRRAARALPAIALAAAAVFALSARDMGGVGHDAEAAARQRETASDAGAIRALAEGRSVVAHPIDGALLMDRRTRKFYMAGSYQQTDPISTEQAWDSLPAYDFVAVPADFGGSLTPDNRRLFLYRPGDLPRAHASIAAREPALRAGSFDVHLDGRRLVYLGRACDRADAGRFFLHVFPADARDLDAGGGARAFNAVHPAYGEHGFEFRERGVRFDGKCMAGVLLPDYPAAAVRTGQYGDGGTIWSGEFPLDPEAWRARFEALAAREPALRARFGVHLEGRTLTYVREDCALSDVEARFFLHAEPLDSDDLPEERRASGFDNLNFAFGERGLRYEGRCMASVALPAYGIARLVTGQFRGGEQLWEGAIAVGH